MEETNFSTDKRWSAHYWKYKSGEVVEKSIYESWKGAKTNGVKNISQASVQYFWQSRNLGAGKCKTIPGTFNKTSYGLYAYCRTFTWV